MICEVCKKNEATVKLIGIIDGNKTEGHLCAECVEKHKQQMRAEGMQSMLSAIISSARKSARQYEGLRCSNCGLSYDEFRKTSRLGCAHCYEDFRVQLKPLLTRLHGRTRHEGRIPERVGEELKRNSRLEKIRREMEVAVACEDFEQAAALRDELKSLTALEGSGANA